MSERQATDRRGTFWDWPVGLMIVAVLLLVFSGGQLLILAALAFCFGLMLWLSRRGTFKPRR